VIGRIIFLVFLLAVCAGIILLQIFLSNKEGKWTGLVLPFISLGIAFMSGFGILMFSAATGTTTLRANGEIIEQTTTQIASTSSIIITAVYIFFLCNIPTGVLVAIYAACRGKRNRQYAVEKMSVQDL